MTRQLACGVITLAAIALLIQPAVGQAPPQPDHKELAKAHEIRAAALTDAKEATAEWRKALKEWQTLLNSAKADLRNLPADATPADVKAANNRFYDAFFEFQRVVTTANAQLIQDPAKLAERGEAVGKNIYSLEKGFKFSEEKMVPGPDGKLVPIMLGTELINPEVYKRYCDLLDKYPAIKQGYKDAGGKFFITPSKP